LAPVGVVAYVTVAIAGFVARLKMQRIGDPDEDTEAA
jgi:hypothetical protein